MLTSKIIKEELKKKGFDTKKISINKKGCGYSESFWITIKDVNIKIKEVEAIVQQFEKIDRDEATYEILEGGNTYIFTRYDYEILNEANEEYNPEVLQIYQKNRAKQESDEIVRIAEKVVIQRNSKILEVVDLEKYNRRITCESNFARDLIELGLLHKVLNKEVL